MNPYRAVILALALVLTSSAMAELVVYDVDAKYRQEVFAALRSVLQRERPGEEALSEAPGSVAMLPTGQLLVDTTPERHIQVAAVLEAISAHQVEAAPRVTLRYWAVLGTPDPTAGRETPAILSETLSELRRIHGDLAFRVIGNATLVTESGQSGSVGGNPFNIRQLAYVEGARLNAELSLSFQYRVVTGEFSGGRANNPFQTIQNQDQSVQLVTSIARDEFVVVGESSVGGMSLGDEPFSGTIFFIVHWPPAD
jgi:hypothetical protein